MRGEEEKICDKDNVWYYDWSNRNSVGAANISCSHSIKSWFCVSAMLNLLRFHFMTCKACLHDVAQHQLSVRRFDRVNVLSYDLASKCCNGAITLLDKQSVSYH